MSELYSQSVGIFRGFVESGQELVAELVAPYHGEYHPMLGSFILVSISEQSALLGRITKFFPVGAMTSVQGDEYLADMSRMRREIPEDLKETKLRYSVKIKLLGTVSLENAEQGKIFWYHPSLRQLPHLGAEVFTPSTALIAFTCSVGLEEDNPATIGHFCLGEEAFDGTKGKPNIEVKFGVNKLRAKRTFVFARTGYGKSNLVKLLIAKLYENPQPTGVLIIDPQGEYSFRDEQGYGLTDVPHLRDKIVVFTDRRFDAPFQRWIAGRARLNLGDLSSVDVVNICLPSARQETNYASAMRRLRGQRWSGLVNLIYSDGFRTEEDALTNLGVGGARPGDIIRNLTPIVSSLHDPDSLLISSILHHLSRGRIAIIDISMLTIENGYKLTGLVLNHIFRHNLESFTGERTDRQIGLVPTIVVLEEAQNVLSAEDVKEGNPFVRWTKEGRKYNLGSTIITQQPGAIAQELLAQGDNFFSFHLISQYDLKALQRDNAHYSDDILTSVLSEPIKGNVYFWAAPDQPFVLSSKIMNFEEYVRDLNKKLKEKEDSSFQTPAEEYIGVQNSTNQALDNLIKTNLENNPKIATYENIQYDDTKLENIYAVKFWNLKFGISEALTQDMIDTQCEDFDGRPVIRDQILMQSLERLGMLEDPATAIDQQNSRFLLLKANKLKLQGKRVKTEEIYLNSNPTV